MKTLLHKMYQLIILRQKGVFGLIMGNQYTAALALEQMYGKKSERLYCT